MILPPFNIWENLYKEKPFIRVNRATGWVIQGCIPSSTRVHTNITTSTKVLLCCSPNITFGSQRVNL